MSTTSCTEPRLVTCSSCGLLYDGVQTSANDQACTRCVEVLLNPQRPVGTTLSNYRER